MDDKFLGFLNMFLKKIMEVDGDCFESDDSPIRSMTKGVPAEDIGLPMEWTSDDQSFPVASHYSPEICKSDSNSFRVYSPEERIFLSREAISYLQKLLWSDIIDIEVHEEIIDKAKIYSEKMAGLEEVKVISSMVLSDRGCAEWHRQLALMVDENPAQEHFH